MGFTLLCDWYFHLIFKGDSIRKPMSFYIVERFIFFLSATMLLTMSYSLLISYWIYSEQKAGKENPVAVTWFGIMIDPSSSEEETDEEGVEEPHRHHHHSQRAAKGQDVGGSFAGGPNNTFGTTPGQLAGHGNSNLGVGGNGAGAASSTAATSWGGGGGGGASNSLDVPQSSGSLPR